MIYTRFLKNYNKFSTIGKILMFVLLFLMVVLFFKSWNNHLNAKPWNFKFKEGFIQTDAFLFKEGPSVYDDFYANIYDFLVFNHVKNEYEIGAIINSTQPQETSVIVDLGCGTGHHVANLGSKINSNSKSLQVLGIDISPSMIEKAKENYPQYHFQVGDIMNSQLLAYQSVTHLLCLYFTIYYIKDKREFFNNCMDWLMPGGYLIVHLVEREKFDPILPPSNPLYIVSPQKYAKKRITHSKINFKGFKYESNFDFDNADTPIFKEKIKYDNGNVRTHEQKLYMENLDDIVSTAQQTGFLIGSIVNLMHCAYEHQYLYIFVKP